MRISDWSSDVCSSDLSLYVTAQDTLEHPVFRVDAATGKVEKLKASPDEFAGNIGNDTPLPGGALPYRSEERGVGKEGVGTCSVRVLRLHETKPTIRRANILIAELYAYIGDKNI